MRWDIRVQVNFLLTHFVDIGEFEIYKYLYNALYWYTEHETSQQTYHDIGIRVAKALLWFRSPQIFGCKNRE